MLTSITYSVVFPISGVTLEGKFQPQPGITAVIGPNGVGKTFTSIELARYLLYGKAALRGAASDYKKLDAVGVFVIRDATYTIKRSAKKEEILDAAGEILAIGADAVTKKVTELMGYGLGVFDVCNASVQKHADMFGSMKPSERKRMIDEVVNLTSAELVEKACRGEANTLKREAEALTRQLTVPEEPKRPAGYIPSEKLAEEYEREEEKFNRAQRIANKMRPAFDLSKPTKPRPNPLVIEALRDADEEFRGVEQRRKELQRIADNPPIPEYTQEQLDAALTRLTLQDIKQGEVECPECHTSFVPGHGHVELPDGPDLKKHEIKQHAQHILDAQAAQEAYAEIQTLGNPKDVSEELKQTLNLQAEWEAYDRLDAQRQAQLAANLEAEKELRAVGDIIPERELDQMKSDLFDSRYYERLLADYEKAKERYDKLSEEITELTRLSGEFRKGGEALSDARATLKAHLAPTFSRVASSLLADMTHGKLSTVEVNEDMDVMVNGQALETLSGGGETVANIALRLALGQVLVSKTFPVFFGDEMDADADNTRREAVAEAMKALIDQKYLKQIILITHRGVDIADHVVDLGNTE